MATIQLGKIKQVWRSTWSASPNPAYSIDDLVEYTDGGVTSTYIATAVPGSQAPSTGGTVGSAWDLVAKGVADPIPTQNSGTNGKILQSNGSALSFVDQAAGLKNSGSNQTVWYARTTSNVDIASDSFTEALTLSIPSLSADCIFMVTFTEERREQSWNTTAGQYQWSADNGSNYTTLSYTDGFWDSTFGASNRIGGTRGSNIYQTHTGTFMVTFSSGQTPKFRINGKRFSSGGNVSNAYMANHEGESSIIAVKVET